MLRACLVTAYEDGLTQSNPPVVVAPGERKRKPKRLTTQTLDLIAAMPEEHADLAYFLAATGCRISEALAIHAEAASAADSLAHIGGFAAHVRFYLTSA